jgi:hypothetical protein
LQAFPIQTAIRQQRGYSRGKHFEIHSRKKPFFEIENEVNMFNKYHIKITELFEISIHCQALGKNFGSFRC